MDLNAQDSESPIIIDLQNSPKILEKNKTWVLKLVDDESDANDTNNNEENNSFSKSSIKKGENNFELQLLELDAEIKQQQVKVKTLKEFQERVSKWQTVKELKSFSQNQANNNFYYNQYNLNSKQHPYYADGSITSQSGGYTGNQSGAYSYPSHGYANTFYSNDRNKSNYQSSRRSVVSSYPIHAKNYPNYSNKNIFHSNHNNSYKNRNNNYSKDAVKRNANKDKKFRGKTKRTFNNIMKKIEQEIDKKDMKVPNEVIILIGAPASGKSTLSASLQKGLEYKNDVIKIRQMSKTLQNRLKKFDIDVLFETLLLKLFQQDSSSGVIIQDMTSISCARILTLFKQYCKNLKEEFPDLPDIKFRICALQINKNIALERMIGIEKYPKDTKAQEKLFEKCVKRIDMVVNHLEEFYVFNKVPANSSKSQIVKEAFDELFDKNNGTSVTSQTANLSQNETKLNKLTNVVKNDVQMNNHQELDFTIPHYPPIIQNDVVMIIDKQCQEIKTNK